MFINAKDSSPSDDPLSGTMRYLLLFVHFFAHLAIKQTYDSIGPVDLYSASK